MGAGLELQEWHGYLGVGLGVRLHAPQSRKRRAVPALGPSAAHAPRGPHPAGLGARKGAEDGGGAMETAG